MPRAFMGCPLGRAWAWPMLRSRSWVRGKIRQPPRSKVSSPDRNECQVQAAAEAAQMVAATSWPAKPPMKVWRTSLCAVAISMW
jgi:hypothetical protein